MTRLQKFAFAFSCLMLATTSQAKEVDIAAVVNEEMISSLDVDQRAALVMITSGVPDAPENRKKVRASVIQSLIDEKLQLQEAARSDVKVSDEEIAQALEQLNQQKGAPAGTLEKFLREKNIPVEVLKDQIRAQISWTKAISQQMRGRVRVSEAEVQRERERVAAGQDITEYNISSIFLPVEPGNEEGTFSVIKEIYTALKDQGNFALVAREYEKKYPSLRVVDKQWVAMHQLEPPLVKMLRKLPKGGMTPPVRMSDGLQIARMHDRRTTNTAQMFDSEVLLKQITMRLKPTAPNQEAKILLDIAEQVSKSPGTCQEKEVAGLSDLDDLEFEIAFKRTAFKDILPELQASLSRLRVGDVTEPYATPEGLHVVMLCERVDKPIVLPPEEAVRGMLMRRKLDAEAKKLMRKLRRDAFIEVR